MATKHMALTDQIRVAIDASGMSRYAICRAIGMSQPVMSRFMHRTGGLSMQMLDALADVLELELTVKSKRPGKGKVKHGKHHA